MRRIMPAVVGVELFEAVLHRLLLDRVAFRVHHSPAAHARISVDQPRACFSSA
jgi:hypothetical protein